MVRTARPRLVRVPCTYSAWHLRVSCPAPLARRWPLSLPWPLSPLATARRRLVRYVQYGGPGTYVSAQTTTRAPSRGSSPLPERSTRFNTPPSPVRSISGGSAAHVTMPALNDAQARLRHDETRGCGASPTAAKTSDASMVKQPAGSACDARHEACQKSAPDEATWATVHMQQRIAFFCQRCQQRAPDVWDRAIGDDILCESRGRSTSRACCWRLHSAEHHEVQGHDAVPRQNSREAMTR